MTMVEEMILSGFISKISSDIADIPENLIKNKIKDADKKRRDKNQSIETRIYQVTIDAIKEFTGREYKGKDVLYDAAESILKGFIRNKDNKTEAVRAGLKMLDSHVTSETCEDFLKILHYEICIDENDILYKEIILHQGEQTFEAIREGFDTSNRNDAGTHEKLNYVIEGINHIDKKIGGIGDNEIKKYEIPIINRAEEYAEKWNKNVFLNDYNEEDENDRTEIKLSDIYIEECLPHYIWRKNIRSKDTLRDLLTKYIINVSDREMLLILGQPGIGKSTLITWIMANLVKKKDEIFVYQFAFDLKKVNWQGDDILEEILEALQLKDEELRNKVLILDGYDEISIRGNRERILNKLYQELKKRNRLGNFSLIITCRENYVNQSCLSLRAYIILQAWDEYQIKRFCDIYAKKSLGNSEAKFPEAKSDEILKNKEILGIPLILYMILALDIAIEKNSSIADIYDQIFSLEKGVIYDRCYDSKHRTNKPEIKKCIHQISQEIAFWIFENNNDEAFIYQKNFKEICDTVMIKEKDKSEDMQSNTLIGSYFKVKHCDGELADEVNFVHRSIYEYFVAVYFFESISNLISKKDVAGKLGELLKDGHLSKEILEFIKYKFDGVKRNNLPDIIEKVFNIMLRDGMVYHFIKEKNKPLLDSLVREMNIFSNMLEIIHLWHDKLEYVDKKIVFYLRYNCSNRLNLSGVNLCEADLRGANLGEADLRGADLSGTDLSEADLRGANLGEADLRGANLSEADLSEADLRGANLGEADLRGADLSEAKLIEVYLSEAKLSKANLRKANLKRADLNGADLRGVKLRGAKLRGAKLSEAKLSEADLRGADISRADMSRTDISRADLSKANLRGTNLSGADFNSADIRKVDLSGANLVGAKLGGAKLKGAKLNGANLKK